MISMPWDFRHVHRVEFAQTDLAGIMHFANFFRYMEVTEHAFFRSLGHSIHAAAGPGEPRLGWPRVHASCDYRMPLFFEDLVEVRLIVREKRARSIDYVHAFRRGTGPAAPVVAVGRIVAVCVRRDPSTGALEPADPPPALMAAIEEAPPSEYMPLLAP
jgi:YbgC/YbaW family acyl-CoA thioester hydrolase